MSGCSAAAGCSTRAASSMKACTVAAFSATSGGCAYTDGKTDRCLRRVLGLFPPSSWTTHNEPMD